MIDKLAFILGATLGFTLVVLRLLLVSLGLVCVALVVSSVLGGTYTGAFGWAIVAATILSLLR